VRLDYTSYRNQTEHKKERAEKRVIHNPGKARTKERQGGE